MSLINDALKQAQSKRSGDRADLPPMPGGGSSRPSVNRGTTPQDKSIVIAIGSAAAVVVVALGLTIFSLTRSAKPAAIANKPVAVKPVAANSPAGVGAPDSNAPSATIGIKIPTLAPAVPAASTTVAVAPPAPAPTGTAAPAPATTEAGAAAAPAKVFPDGQDIRMLTFIDSLRVAGIRSSATGSKVLMNDRVYRLNDMVDYTLGLRLTKVSTEGLTFTDPNGVTYVKNF
ncbi:MAG: hypothetical protein JWM32_2363 [Verrucomicrobia bacterium]|nr:hypothetical protein [Verrucomicrobiota bacterium]